MSERKPGWKWSLWAAITVLVALAAVVAAWIMAERSGDHDLTGHISVTGECPPTEGVQMLVADVGGDDLGSGQVTGVPEADACDLEFGFPVARSDAYVFSVEPATGEPIEGPTLSPNDLRTGDWSVTFSSTDFPGLEERV